MNPVHGSPADTRVEGVNYSKDKFEKINFFKVKSFESFIKSKCVTWINVEGKHNAGIIEKVCKGFNLHHLVVEDILSGNQRPKFEDYDDYVFIVLRLFYTKGRRNAIESEQVSIVVGKNYVLSFQENHSNIFEDIIERIDSGKVKIREKGPDYLAYALIDVVVDNHYSIIEKVGEDIEALESDLLSNPDSETIEEIYSFKQKMIMFSKSVWTLREALNEIMKNESVISRQTKIYMRDIYDHASRIIDSIETYRDMVSGMIELYSTKSGHRMNEVMKTLTIIATIFIPLTFIAGLYGMNFKVMPELEWKYAYFVVLFIMLGVAFGMTLYFRRKKWI